MSKLDKIVEDQKYFIIRVGMSPTHLLISNKDFAELVQSLEPAMIRNMVSRELKVNGMQVVFVEVAEPLVVLM